MKKIDQINEKLNKGRGKLKQIKERYNTDSQKISEMIRGRANLLADEAIESNPKRKKEIDDLNKEIENLRRTIESRGPELVSALEKKLQEIESEKANEELRLSFEKQKKLGSKIVNLSERLIENLGQANSTNEELNRAWNEYIGLSKATSKAGIKEGSKTTRGSFGSLKFLWNVINFEYNEGKPRPKGELPMGIKL
ncbi:hypothetical protein ES702_00321 [subsurface metagenome]